MKQASTLALLTLLFIEIVNINTSDGFAHLALLHTTTDLQRMNSLVAAQRTP
jgi:hypothetical protein